MTATIHPRPDLHEPFIPASVPIQDHGGPTTIPIRRTYYVMDAITNRCIAAAAFTNGARWSWVQEVVAGEFECEPSAVGRFADAIFVDGHHVATVTE